MNILALAYLFPPDSGSGTYRSLYFFNHLVGFGNEVTVITAKEKDFSPDANLDYELLRIVDNRIRVVRASVIRPLMRLLRLRDSLKKKDGPQVPQPNEDPPHRSTSGLLTNWAQVIKDTISDALTWPDEHVGWIPDAMRQAARVVQSTSIDCIYASGGPWSSLVAGALLKRKYGIPLVLDFRDPWTGNPSKKHRGALINKCSGALESFCIRSADFIIANTEELREDFVRRYPKVRRERFVTITNGFEEIYSDSSGQRNQKFTLVHAGELYQSRNPANFLRAILLLLQEKKIPESEIRIHFVGGRSRAGEMDSILQADELKRVVEMTPRVSYGTAIQYQRVADVLIVFQAGFPSQVPRKLYEYMSLLKPVLAIAEPASATARVIGESKVGIVADLSVEAIADAISRLYEAWKTGMDTTVNREYVERYRNRHLATELQAVLRTACGLSRSRNVSTGETGAQKAARRENEME